MLLSGVSIFNQWLLLAFSGFEKLALYERFP